MTAVVDDLFRLSAGAEKTGKNFVVHQPKQVRTELAILSALASVIATNVAVDYCDELFASDASMVKGAYVATSLSEEEAEVLWIGSDEEGGYTVFWTPSQKPCLHSS